MPHILIADDDEAIAGLIADALQDEGYTTQTVSDGTQAYAAVQHTPFDLILLDVMMPHMDGLELMRKIRDEVSSPIVFVTAKNRTLDTMMGLEMGADDYITKPFIVEELVARVKAHLRREERKSRQQASVVCAVGPFVINKDSYEVRMHGREVALTTREFQLLSFLMDNAGRVLTREQIFNAVWGVDYGDIGTVAVNIKNLRHKIDPRAEWIKTIWGVGYKLVGSRGEEDER